MATKKRPVIFYVESEEHADYLDRIAEEKGFKNKGEMARYALAKLMTGYRIPFTPESPVTGRE